jgi:hypothetical protein
MTVPAVVPSDTQSSVPAVGLKALKNARVPATVKSLGKELPPPGSMSFSSAVPASAPLVANSS